MRVEGAREDLDFLESSAFVPLAVGNSWKFAHDYAENIVGTMLMDGHLYYQFDRFDNTFNNAWLRMTEMNQLLVRQEATEQVWLDFAAEVGAAWTVHGPDGQTKWTVHLESKSDTVTVPAGTFVQCYRFYFQFNGADNDLVEWYAPGVGAVKRDLYGIGFIEFPLLEAVVNQTNLPTAAPGDHAGASARTFELAQNYPNPFSLNETVLSGKSTSIAYRLAQAGPVELTIYDLLGRKTRTLVRRNQSAGTHAATWDGTDSRNAPVSAGVYVYRLAVGGSFQTRRLIVLR